MKCYLARTALLAAMLAGPAFAEETPPHIDTSGVNAQPAYPASALPNKERGAVLLRVGVSADGKVTQIRPLQTSGFDDLDSAAISGVMAWRFLPAKKDGQAVPGEANIQIGFVPPDDTSATTDIPKPKADYLPSLQHMESARGYYHQESAGIPCSNGLLQSTVEILHSNGAPGSSGYATSAAIGVDHGQTDKPDSEWLRLYVIGREFITPPQETFEITTGKGDTASKRVTYSYSAILGREETIRIRWDFEGKLSATVGIETHRSKISAAPDLLTLVVSGGSVNFHDAEGICYPASPFAGD